MGSSSCFNIRTLYIIIVTLHNLLLGFVKHIFIILLSQVHIPKSSSSCLSEEEQDDQYYINESQVEEDHRPSPSLVPVLVALHFIGESMREKLPVVEYYCLVQRRLGHACKKVDNEVCVVCLRCMEASDEIRELVNCSHVFHKECLDAWVDEGQVSCPLCRSKMLADQNRDGQKKHRCGGDPWRKERMVYLFGDDIMLCSSNG